jgi:gamma-glutamyl hercynylcysteine S-oxide hydrolase
MCRIAAYFGPPVRLSSLLHEPPHGLTDQSRNARQMTDSSIAGDGWGVGWFHPEAGPTPGMLKSILPLWSDENAKTATHAILSGSVLGHVRYASPSIEVCFTNMPLYVLDDHLWTINGELQPWPGPLSKALRDRLDPDHEADLRGATDGEMLGAMWRTQFRQTGGKDAVAALRSTLRQARDLAREHDGEVKTNLMLASGTEVLAVRYAEPGEANTLYYLEGEPRWHGGAVVASEPLDDGAGWHEVGPDTLVRVDARGVRLEALGLDRAELPPRHRLIA